ncbi:MAG: sporulation protein, partial [Gammaproteobacteria bacterium]
RQDHFAWFETRHRGRPWYVVVYGYYPDRERARAALARLPASLKKGRPWLRRVGEIQQILRG